MTSRSVSCLFSDIILPSQHIIDLVTTPTFIPRLNWTYTLHRQVYRIQYRTWNIDHTRHSAYQCLLVPVTYTHSHSHHSLPLGWCYTETSSTVFSDISPPTTDLLILTSVVTSVGTLLILRVYQPLCQELSQMT